MTLKTKIPVVFNKPVSGTDTGVLIGTVIDSIRKGRDYYAANYALFLESGAVLNRSSFELKSEEEIIALNDTIKGGLPDYNKTTTTEFEELKSLLELRIEMYKLLLVTNPKLNIEDIEVLPIEVSYEK